MKKIFIRTDGAIEEVQRYLLSLITEDEEYYAGDCRVVVYDPEDDEPVQLGYIYDMSEKAICVLKEHYGDYNVELDPLENSSDLEEKGEDNALVRIAVALEEIARKLDDIGSISQLMQEDLSALSSCIDRQRFCIAGDAVTDDRIY